MPDKKTAVLDCRQMTLLLGSVSVQKRSDREYSVGPKLYGLAGFGAGFSFGV